MKIRIKFLAVTLALLMLVGTISASPAFAYSWTTGSRYMNGYEMYGKLWGYSSSATASTYCENISYGKKVAVVYHCYIENQLVYFKTETDTYVVNGFESFSLSADHPDRADSIPGVEGKHWVKASSHMYWSSEESDCNTRVCIEDPFFDVIY